MYPSIYTHTQTHTLSHKHTHIHTHTHLLFCESVEFLVEGVLVEEFQANGVAGQLVDDLTELHCACVSMYGCMVE
jgi:hypothetical protein